MSIKSKLGWILLSGASLAAMGALTPAMAQDAEDTSEEIVVTATGRTAAIQDVPIAVTAVGHEQLEQAGVNSLVDLRQVTPNLRIGAGQSQTSGTSASIRGLGTGSDNPGFEAAVGIFIDGVYRARTGAAISDLADVERVEILRGPQGTLFGKNTTAGAISVVTAAPDFETGMWLEGSAGDLGLLGTRFGANLPVSDNVAFRFDGTMRGRDGYIENVTSPGDDTNTTDRWTARGQMLWDITPNASLRVIADAAETNEVCCGAVTLYDSSLLAPFPFVPAVSLTNGPGTILTDAADQRRTTITPGHNYNESSEESGISAQLDWDLGNVHLTSITAYRDWDSLRDQDIDFSSMDRSYRDGLAVGVSGLTQEIRLQGEWGRVNWLVGGFYGDEEITQTDRIQYGTQAATYIDRLLGFFDFTAVGSPDNNGAIPGSGDQVFSCTPGAPGASTCALDYSMAALAFGAGPLGANAAVAGTSAQLAGGIGTFSTALVSSGLPAGAGQQGDNWGIDTQTFAIFTHNEINLSDNLTLTLGARWTQEEKDMSADLNASQPACAAIRANQDRVLAALVVKARADAVLPTTDPTRQLADGLPGALTLACNPAVNDIQDGAYAANQSEDAISGTASLSYNLSDDIMIYGGYSRGFKSGGFNIDRSGMNVLPWTTIAPLSAYGTLAVAYLATQAGQPQYPDSFGADDLGFQPETIDAYELGFKSTIFGGTSTLNVAAFYEQLHDYQLNAFNGFNFITRNVPEVISQGVELEFATRPIDNLFLTFGALYNDVYYDSTVQFSTTDAVISGDPLTQSPEWTITGSANYQVPVSESMHINLYANGRWLSDYRLQTLSRNPVTDQDAFAIFDARVGLAANDDRWGIDFWVRNLTDEYYSIDAFAVPEQSLFSAGTGQVEGRFAAYPNEPRTMGVTLRARY